MRPTEEDRRPEEPPAKGLRASKNELPEETPGPKELRLPEEDLEMATKPPSLSLSQKESEKFIDSMVIATWNHNIAVGLLQASFESRMLHLLMYNYRDRVLTC